MKLLKKIKVALFFIGLWLACFLIYLSTTLGTIKYASSQGAARSLEKWSVCSGEVYKYDLGYRCDAYAPNAFLLTIILIGIISFICAVFALIFALTRKAK